MVLNLSTGLVFRCPECGRQEIRQINIFEFSGGGHPQVNCSCGFPIATLGCSDYERYWIQFFCIICEEEHRMFFDKKEFWGKRVKHLNCLNSDFQVGLLGPGNVLEEYLQQLRKDLALLINEMDFDDYFNNPQLILSTLDLLHDIAEEGGIDCPCGKPDLEVEMYPDRIKLSCRHCGASSTISARTEKDLRVLRDRGRIKLKKHSRLLLEPDK